MTLYVFHVIHKTTTRWGNYITLRGALARAKLFKHPLVAWIGD